MRWLEHHPFNGHDLCKHLVIVKEREAWCAAVHGVADRGILLTY